jgi:membrane protease subunit HflK
MSDQQSSQFKPPAVPPAPEQPGADDPGTQALAEALRSSFFIIQIIMVLLVVLFFGSGFFTVKEGYKAIILRMGRPVGVGEGVLLGPGFHIAYPRPIDEVTNIPFSLVQRADSTIGWFQTVQERAKNPSLLPPPTQPLDPASTVSYMLTADTNIIHLEAFVTYRITKPTTYYFDFADAAQFVTNDLNNALLFAASRFKVDDILSVQVEAFREAVEERMRELTDQQALGITVERVDCQHSAPGALLNDFNSVVKASADHEKTLSQADVYRSKILGDARGQRESRTNTAFADSVRMVRLLAAEQTNFSVLLDYYNRDPALVTSLLQTESLKEVWSNAQNTIILPGAAGDQFRIHLNAPLAPFTTTNNQPNP